MQESHGRFCWTRRCHQHGVGERDQLAAAAAADQLGDDDEHQYGDDHCHDVLDQHDHLQHVHRRRREEEEKVQQEIEKGQTGLEQRTSGPAHAVRQQKDPRPIRRHVSGPTEIQPGNAH